MIKGRGARAGFCGPSLIHTYIGLMVRPFIYSLNSILAFANQFELANDKIGFDIDQITDGRVL
jgi:hypothetical protein